MLYFQKAAQISPQVAIIPKDLDSINYAINGKQKAIEPAYSFIPSKILKRMVKLGRMGVGAALAIIENEEVHGIIIFQIIKQLI